MTPRLEDAELARFAAVLRRGGVLACATETLVGLLADALDEAAVARVVAIKRRGSSEAIALLLPDLSSIARVAEAPSAQALELARRHWPGPLTLLLRARATLPSALVRDGKVGVRVPGESPALALVRAFGGPLTATSANRSGEPACRTAAQALALLGDEVDGVVPGDAPGGLPSTILDATATPPTVVRAGAAKV